MSAFVAKATHSAGGQGYIPKFGSDKMRPMRIPTIEDKLVQNGLNKIFPSSPLYNLTYTLIPI